MNKPIEKFVLGVIMTPEQRQTIWDSLDEARISAKKHKDLEKMGKIEVVMHDIGKMLNINVQPLPDETILMRTKLMEVLGMSEGDVDKVLENVYKRGVQEGLQKFDQIRKAVQEQI